MTAFVILHYKALEDTERCIETALSIAGKKGIVVIDNASPDGSGMVIREKYSDNPSVLVILNEKNLGFSKANNIGCRIAREKWDPDYYVVANNDISFPQAEFIDKIETLYKRYAFSVLGPDIVNTRCNIHQNPQAKNPPSLNRARKTVFLNVLCHKMLLVTYPVMKLYYHNIRENPRAAVGYDHEQEDVLLSGACLVFSRDYVHIRGNVFSPETFFFSEEPLFTIWCRKHDKKIIYSPMLKVFHNESASTYLETNSYRRISFQMKNIIDSTKIYIRELERDN